MPADVELNVKVTKKGDGADKVAHDLKVAARAADGLDDNLKQVNRQLVEMKALAGAAAKEFQKTGDISPLKQVLKDQRQLEQVQRSLKGAADAAKGVGDESSGTGKFAVQLGVAAHEADSLDDNLKQVERRLAEIKLLSAGAGRNALLTGDLGPLKALEQEEQVLQKILQALKKGGGEAESLGEKISNAFSEALDGLPLGIGNALKAAAANPELAGLGLAIGLPVVAGIGAALTGAALAGTAAVGLAGGILLAAKDARVHAAWVAFANEAGQDLQEASSVFAKPLAAAATTVGDAFHDIMPLIEKDFATLAPVVDRLAAGAAGFIKAFAPGFSSGIQAGAKVFAQFADELPGLGAAVGFFFDELAAGAEGGGSALVTTLRAAEFAVEGLGAALHSASDAFVLFGGTAEFATSKLNDGAVAGITFGSGLVELGGHFLGLDDKTKQSSKSQEEFFHKMEDAKEAAKAEAQAQRENAAAIEEARNAIKNMINDMLGLDGATLNFNSAVPGVTDSVKQNGRSLNEHTAAGIANRQALLNGVSAAEKLREEMIKQRPVHGRTRTQVYEQNIQKLKAPHGRRGERQRGPEPHRQVRQPGQSTGHRQDHHDHRAVQAGRAAHERAEHRQRRPGLLRGRVRPRRPGEGAGRVCRCRRSCTAGSTS
jgi:hypothetical protein